MVLQERYRGVDFIIESGFGRTFLAVDEHKLDTPCVVKQFLPRQSGSTALEKATELCKQEALRLRDLGKHSQIPDLLAFFQQQGRLYLIQEFITGQNLLNELKQKGKFSESEVKNILTELLPVLQFIHDNQVIHRDIKPENIIRSSQNGALFLVNFGVSDELCESVIAKVGTITGTPGYAPPEQFRGIVFPTSDLYSLAVTCIHLLTGHLQKSDGSNLLLDSTKIQWVWKNYASVSHELEIILDKMLEDLPINRFQSATAVLSALQTRKFTPAITPPPAKPLITQKEDLGNGVILEMVAIPGGTFLMGSPQGEGYDWEKPQHQVTVPPFYMGKYPVTQAQWEKVADLPKVKIDLNPKPSRFQGANLPVECVSWFDAVEFCARISRGTGRTYRLPSEAEWEYACRANTTTPYYFGNTITTDLVNHYGKYKQTTDVGNFPQNAFGLYDMHGNVWEWCEDCWHENYINAPNNGSAWVSDENLRIMRGGSWILYPRRCRSAYRLNVSPSYSYKDFGFRLVVSGTG
jgi:hypothetical protein